MCQLRNKYFATIVILANIFIFKVYLFNLNNIYSLVKILLISGFG